MNIILTGFSGTGKTAIGYRIASLLGWQFVDIDEVVAEKAKKSVARIFDEDGEPIFRDYESKTVAEQCQLSNLVIATGGGAIVNDQNRHWMRTSGFLVCLEASSETINFRLRQALSEDQDDKSVRPLLGLKDGDATPLIESMKRERQWAYSMSHWTVNTDHLSIEQVAQEIVRAWKRLGAIYSKSQDPQIAASVITEQSSYPIIVGSEILQEQLGDRMLATGLDGRAYVICDQNVIHPYGRMVQQSLHKAGIEAHFFIFPPGEASKSMETAQILFNWLSERQVERRDTVIGVGGGVAGDLAGFVAATYLRGLKYVHVPTSMVAMVDSSIGGKTAVDLPSGKNLIGAFHAPSLVLSDIATLSTLPKRALVEGYAEAIKHGLIMDPFLVEIYDSKMEDLLRLEPNVTTEVVARNVALKSTVVTEDEKETSGLRTLLNYGHTIGHGIEAAAGFDSYLHGEAVAIGMIGASKLGNKVGITPEYLIGLQQDLFRKFGLPDRAEGVTREQVLGAMARDKKRELGQVNWVFLEAVGSARTYRGVSLEEIDRILADLGIN